MAESNIKPFKLGALRGDDWVPFVHPDVYQTEQTTGPERLVIAPATDHVGLLVELARLLPEPFGILYLLLTSRRGQPPGRYQCPEPVTRDEAVSFLVRFKEFFEDDGRHHVWVTSLPTQSTLVYNNHNVIYAYGPLDTFKRLLGAHGLTEGAVTFPTPHAHQYNQDFDKSETDILSYWEWRRFPLAESDDE